MEKMREKIQSLKAERRNLESEKAETASLVTSLRENLIHEQGEFRRREEEWKIVNKDAHEASILLNELRANAQIQAAHITQLSDELRSVQAEKNTLKESLQSKEKLQAEFEKGMRELNLEREKLNAKLSKRETKLKDVPCSIFFAILILYRPL